MVPKPSWKASAGAFTGCTTPDQYTIALIKIARQVSTARDYNACEREIRSLLAAGSITATHADRVRGILNEREIE